MSVAAHLGIRLSEYDHRIRTFIPAYAELLAATAAAVPSHARSLVDLGVGTGALASRCVRRARRAHVTGVDADEAILALARARLGAGATLVHGNLLRATLPSADAFVSSLTLHHVRTTAARLRLFGRLRRLLPPRGVFVVGDCYPSADRGRAAAERRAWVAHLRRTYSPAQAATLLRAWAREDRYVALERELALLRRAGFRPRVAWRRGAFAVIISSPLRT
jgi:tRNA (cmo5U34)-methyltransferase